MDVDESQRLFKRLYISGEDLAMARQFATFLIKKQWHQTPWERRGSIYMQQTAFTSALVIFYARPFTRSAGLPSFPKRLLRFDESEEALHKTLLTLRHKVYAHSDDESYEVRPISFGRGFQTAIFRPPHFKLSGDETKRAIVIIDKLLVGITSELSELGKELT